MTSMLTYKSWPKTFFKHFLYLTYVFLIPVNNNMGHKAHVLQFFIIHKSIITLSLSLSLSLSLCLSLSLSLSLYIYIYIYIYILGQKSWQLFFFDDTSPVGKCDIYRRKDKVLTTCMDMNRTDIPHDTYTFVIRSHISTK